MRNVSTLYRSLLPIVAALALVCGSISAAQADGGPKHPNLDKLPKLEVHLGSPNVTFDDAFEFKGVVCFQRDPISPTNPSRISLQVGSYMLNNLLLKRHTVGKDKDRVFYTFEGLIQVAQNRWARVELKVEPLGQNANGFCYLVKLEVEGVELSNVNLSQPVLISGSVNNVAFTSFSVWPEMDDEDDD